MDPELIDGFGMVETPEQSVGATEDSPGQGYPPQSEPLDGPMHDQCQDDGQPAPPSTKAAPDFPPASDAERRPINETGPSRGTDLDPTVVAAEGDNSNAAGRDIDNSLYKQDWRHSVIALGPDFPGLASALARRKHGRGIQDPGALKRRADHYVAPKALLETDIPRDRTAYEVLRDTKVLLLSGDNQDCGQFSAALRLGWELRVKHDSRLVVREELVDPDALRPEDLFTHHEPAAVIVDFRSSGNDVLQKLDRNLGELSRRAEDYLSYLILIIPPKQEKHFDQQLPGRVHRLGKPPSQEVLALHLDNADICGAVETSGTGPQLEALYPPQIKSVADSVRDLLARGEPLAEALAAALHREPANSVDALRETVERRQSDEHPEWLALLIAVAVLEGASPQHIVRASKQLLEHNGYTHQNEEAPIPLLRPSPLTRLRQLAEDPSWFDLRTRQLVPAGFATQVLHHFWFEYDDDLRDRLLQWFSELPRKIGDLGRHELEQIADRAADIAVEAGPNLALALAGDWAKTGVGERSNGAQTSINAPDRYRRSVAVRLLTTTAMDARIGQHVRRRLLQWARSSNADLNLLTAEVCAGIGGDFPHSALTRLKHLADSENELVRESVVKAIVQIGCEQGISRLLDRLTAWFADAPPIRLAVLATSVKEVLSQHPVEVDLDTASEFWQQAMDEVPPENLHKLVSGWVLSAAESPPEQQPGLIEPLVQATGHVSRRIAYMHYAITFGLDAATPGPPDDNPISGVVRVLRTRLHEADPMSQE